MGLEASRQPHNPLGADLGTLEQIGNSCRIEQKESWNPRAVAATGFRILNFLPKGVWSGIRPQYPSQVGTPWSALLPSAVPIAEDGIADR
jgi:hypothetical protein